METKDDKITNLENSENEDELREGDILDRRFTKGMRTVEYKVQWKDNQEISWESQDTLLEEEFSDKITQYEKKQLEILSTRRQQFKKPKLCELIQTTPTGRAGYVGKSVLQTFDQEGLLRGVVKEGKSFKGSTTKYRVRFSNGSSKEYTEDEIIPRIILADKAILHMHRTSTSSRY